MEDKKEIFMYIIMNKSEFSENEARMSIERRLLASIFQSTSPSLIYVTGSSDAGRVEPTKKSELLERDQHLRISVQFSLPR